MIFKLIFLPFILLFQFFRLHWAIFFGLALGVGYLGYQEYQTAELNFARASERIAQGAPDATPLSKWNATTDVDADGEVNVQGLYFPGLQSGSIDPFGPRRAFIMLADDLGREVKAVLVVHPNDLPQLQSELAQQGRGDRIPVTVNGAFSQSAEWADLIWTELFVMDVPRADDVVILEPYLGSRAAAINEEAENSLLVAIGIAVIAGFFALVAVAKLLFGGKSAATQSQRSAKAVHAAREAKTPSQKAPPTKAPTNKTLPNKTPPNNGAPAASPWGSFQPQPRAGGPAKPSPSKGMVKPQSEAQLKAKKKPRQSTKTSEEEPQPDFKSVFPGGGSSFRYKSADQIIRQSFGTFSAPKLSKHED